ncbi:MAG: hypothetical protein JXB29_05980 [Sedimentisphaerales bacterium]|nr:hypothetical protein [Sedimentisphaerales bacterium]
MPIGKRRGDNAMLYTVITFAGLFIAATVAAVVFYLKFEEQRKETISLGEQKQELATSQEWTKRGSLVGSKQSRETYLGKALSYIDQMVYLVIGGMPEQTSAEVKVDTAGREVKTIIDTLAVKYSDITTADPNTTGLVRIIENLNAKLQKTEEEVVTVQSQLGDLQNRFNDAMSASFEKEQKLLAEKDQYQQLVNEISQDYNDLKSLLEKTTEQQVQTLVGQLEQQRAESSRVNQDLLKRNAELRIAENRIQHLQKDIEAIKPLPDSEAKAFNPDGKVIMVDDQTKIVHLNIGRREHVYQGLTFSVYDKNLPVPREGKGKAEVEVFDVEENISTGRIVRSEIKRPIVVGDAVANLIWDAEETNIFAVVGDFDINGDGNIDQDGLAKVVTLIEKWGGKVPKNVLVETDFLILGSAPEVLKRPTFEQLEVDPMAMDKYEASLDRLSAYKDAQNQAKSLSVPIMNTERFLYFIGYKTRSAQPGAFSF